MLITRKGYWRTVLLILFFVLPAAAFAQTSNTPPACWPRDAGGTGTPVVVKAGIAGLSYGWFCPESHTIKVVTGPWRAFLPNFEEQARQLMVGTDQDRLAAWKKYVTRTAPLSDGLVVLRDAVVADVKTRYLVATP